MNALEHFIKLNKIPRPSFKEEKIAHYLVQYAIEKISPLN